MGRRALPKIDPRVDYQWHLCQLDDLSGPLEIQQWFAREGSLEIEVGSGKGLFLLNWSARFPDRLFLGCEISKKYARFAAYRLAKHDRRNARIIRGDALKLFAEYLPDRSAGAVHVYFPDPWWKARHRKRRIMQPAFVDHLQRVLEPGGSLHFWTDVEEYFQSTLALLAGWPQLSGPLAEPPLAIDRADARTHFERRMRINQHAVFRAHFRRQ